VAYHEEQLATLVHHVKLAVERFQAGEIDAFEVDEIILRVGVLAGRPSARLIDVVAVNPVPVTIADGSSGTSPTGMPSTRREWSTRGSLADARATQGARSGLASTGQMLGHVGHRGRCPCVPSR
jgi:hypothetical protein